MEFVGGNAIVPTGFTVNLGPVEVERPDFFLFETEPFFFTYRGIPQGQKTRISRVGGRGRNTVDAYVSVRP